MTSQKESTRSTQYDPFYENEQFERRISQWRLLPESYLDVDSAGSLKSSS